MLLPPFEEKVKTYVYKLKLELKLFSPHGWRNHKKQQNFLEFLFLPRISQGFFPFISISVKNLFKSHEKSNNMQQYLNILLLCYNFYNFLLIDFDTPKG